MRRGIAVFLCALLIGSTLAQDATAADPLTINSVFSKLIPSPTLANPSAIVMDEATGEVIYGNNAYAGRKPASVIKLISATAAYTHLNPADTFTTSVFTGIDSASVVIKGSYDPWFSFKKSEADAMGRTSMQKIEYTAYSTLKSLRPAMGKESVVYYSNLYHVEVDHMRKYFKSKNASTIFKPLPQSKTMSYVDQEVFSSSSPTLAVIVDWTLTWSDNLLAERIAKLASVAAGNPFTEEGVSLTFHQLLTNLGVSTNNLVVKDASGLSRENRVTAYQIAQLLMVIRHNPQYLPLIDGLPVGGKTGTLRKRFIETAPSAIGLVKAKTGTLNGTANLAGYVESGDRIYIFVIIADQLSHNYSASEKARAAVDKILGKIASPLLPVITAPPADSATAVTP